MGNLYKPAHSRSALSRPRRCLPLSFIVSCSAISTSCARQSASTACLFPFPTMLVISQILNHSNTYYIFYQNITGRRFYSPFRNVLTLAFIFLRTEKIVIYREKATRLTFCSRNALKEPFFPMLSRHFPLLRHLKTPPRGAWQNPHTIYEQKLARI